ncbi:MAG: hypothetical protein ACJA0F_002340 [Dinoroseobacter sp.]
MGWFDEAERFERGAENEDRDLSEENGRFEPKVTDTAPCTFCN